MNDKLLAHLITCGIDPAAARIAVTSAPADVFEPDDLTKAMRDLEGAFAEKVASEQEHTERLVKAMAHAETAEAARDAISVYGDKMLSEVVAHNDALAKGSLAILAGLRRIEDKVGGLISENASLRSEIEDMKKGLDVPNPPRGVQATLFDKLDHPGDGAGSGDDGEGMAPEVLSKAIKREMDAGCSKDRRAALIDAESKNLSGVNPADLAKQYDIKV